MQNSQYRRLLSKMSHDFVSQEKKKRRIRKKRSLAICTTYCQFDIVRTVAKSLGMRDVPETAIWDIFWTDMSVSLERAKRMKGFQRVNHFPGMSEICRKDLLARNMMRMKKLFPEEYSFFPKTWILPADYGNLSGGSSRKIAKIFILKPFLSSQGKGIFLSIGLKNISYFERMICQKYITKPFLIDGFKFDLRIYTLMTSCDPLRIFVYNEGLVRFATSKYSRPSNSNIKNVYMHLTNYAVNRFSRTYIPDGENGSKRKLSTLNKWLSNHGYDVAELWKKIDDVIIKTILSAYQTLKHNYWACFSSRNNQQACFELLGFDIILNYKLQPFLLEVNHSPSFGTRSDVDKDVKTSLMHDTFEILNINKQERTKVEREVKERCKGRLQGMNGWHEKQADMLKRQKKLKDQEKWEEEHMGNFRMIYPASDSSKYDIFMADENSILQTTIATRSREEAVRKERVENQEKGRLNAAQVKSEPQNDTMKRKEISRITQIAVENGILQKVKSLKETATVKITKPENAQGDHKEPVSPKAEENYIKNSFEPHALETNVERRARLIALKRREMLIMKSELPSLIYFSFKRHNNLTYSDKMKYGHLSET
ncbi:tubulin polyglutamylase TTLL6-like [Ischnura elegans]|uniref:tubulin polyglutamylase TTLL6-like n=1 Tax=Ischnura elegans TaxID=197161 RepID=UPI001ED8B6ED|nr:tubulin polyglutamylase TTLL6-like [Ischnura elegans]XP_046399769.1 tubulin polyglutamylase TTLL6-like [Ischnura elegans]XP_046399770.1 tubulin polyglutamylase TTLL6-like [Ischnura elegans]